VGRQPDLRCPIARSLSVLGERWTFLILREALLGSSRFGQFQENLGVAPDVLSDRLATLVRHGVLEQVPYQEPGARARHAYQLTASGRELAVILGALQRWGDAHLPWPDGPPIRWREAEDDRPVRVAFVDDGGHELALGKVIAVPADPSHN
jgi:DNA-binding HxlR family transcriptional regulator